MPGGLLQLVSRGSQDMLLTGNPSVSFFKKVFNTYTNFAMESVRVSIDKNTMNYSTSTIFISKLKRHGDLLNQIYFSVLIPPIMKINSDNFEFVQKLGEAMLMEYHIYVGGSVIDRQYGEWLHIWNELTMSSDKRYGYDRMIGNVSELYSPDPISTVAIGDQLTAEYRIFVPLRFWFNRNPGLALPLVALQYHDVELHIELRPMKDLFTVNGIAPTNVHRSYFGESEQIFVDPFLELNYIFLDNAERNFFANSSHDYLIEQISKLEVKNVADVEHIELPLANPVKEIIWCYSRSKDDTTEWSNDWFKYHVELPVPGGTHDTDECAVHTRDIMAGARILFNGLERIERKEAAYFNLIQPFQHHTIIPKRGIYCYSFSINPEHFQPSGACNMSRIKRVHLALDKNRDPALTGVSFDVRVYIVRYNFLRVMSGLGSTAYAY